MIEIGDGTVRTHWIDGAAGRNLAGPHRMVLGVLAESVDLGTARKGGVSYDGDLAVPAASSRAP
jgi:hypothetical protein